MRAGNGSSLAAAVAAAGSIALLAAAPTYHADEEASVAGFEVSFPSLEHVLSAGCMYYCRSCPGDNRHDIVIAVDSTHESSHLETCNPGSCEQHECEPQFASSSADREQEILVEYEWAQLNKAVAAARSTEDVKAIFRALGGRAQYNPTRDAIQLVGCNDLLAASINLSPEGRAWRDAL
jgi:hypothetical protein